MTNKFAAAMEYVFKQEGRFADLPNDRGGPTMLGITQNTYDHWRRMKGLPTAPVSALSRSAAAVIYREWYWDAACCELLPPALSICAFDAIVNHRAQVAIALMQSALDVPADGIIGPVTRKAYSEAVDSPQLVWKFVAERLDLYAAIVFDDPSQRGFLKGWLRRAHALEQLMSNTSMKGAVM